MGADADDFRSRLAELRAAIDRVDDEILALLDRRAEIVNRVGDLKRAHGARFHVPQRERAILDRLTAAPGGPFPREAVRPIFREIISACLALETPLVVSYPAPEASFSHLAGRTRFGLFARYVPAVSLEEVFREVEAAADYGVVPVEEASEGLVAHALDRFIESDLLIVGEVLIEPSYALLTRSGTTSGVERVYAHPVAAARCAAALVEAVPGATVLPAASAAAAAAMARDDVRAAAVGPELAAELFDLAVARRRLDAGPVGLARFLVIGKRAPSPTGADATSLLFGVDDSPGRLARVLDRLADAGLNLRRIASRPAERRGLRELFFVDVDGHREEPALAAAIAQLESELPFVKVLGSYPRATAGEAAAAGGGPRPAAPARGT